MSGTRDDVMLTAAPGMVGRRGIRKEREKETYRNNNVGLFS